MSHQHPASKHLDYVREKKFYDHKRPNTKVPFTVCALLILASKCSVKRKTHQTPPDPILCCWWTKPTCCGGHTQGAGFPCPDQKPGTNVLPSHQSSSQDFNNRLRPHLYYVLIKSHHLRRKTEKVKTEELTLVIRKNDLLSTARGKRAVKSHWQQSRQWETQAGRNVPVSCPCPSTPTLWTQGLPSRHRIFHLW